MIANHFADFEFRTDYQHNIRKQFSFYIIIRSPGRLSVEVKGYTVHSIQRLLNKLVNCGAGGLLLALTRDFLTLKEQYVGVG